MEKCSVLLVANCKSLFSADQTREIVKSGLFEMESNRLRFEIFFCPSLLHLDLCKSLGHPGYVLCSQNCSPFEMGSYTGEVSVEQLKEFGVEWVIVGHSDRRCGVLEKSEVIGKKVKIAQDHGLGVIVCIGENLVERNAGFTSDVIEKQVKDVVGFVADWSKVIFAYEPVWSYESNNIVTPDQVAQIKTQLFSLLSNLISPNTPSQIKFIYGALPNNPLDFLESCQISGYLFTLPPNPSSLIPIFTPTSN